MSKSKRVEVITKTKKAKCIRCKGTGGKCKSCSGTGVYKENSYIIIDKKNKIAIDGDTLK